MKQSALLALAATAARALALAALVAVPAAPEPLAAPDSAVPSYHPYAVESPEAFRQLVAERGRAGMALVYKVNRVDRWHVRVGDTLAIPDLADELTLSPFPRAVDSLRAVPRLLLVSRRVQAFGAFERGALARWGPVSTGKPATPTPAGLFAMNWKARRTVSTEDPLWVLDWYVNFDNRRGLSLHEFELPGYPASHACVRLLEDDARWLYEWADEWILAPGGRSVAAHGTPILVFGDYARGQRPPWKWLAGDPRATDVTPAEIDSALAGTLPEIRERLVARAALLAGPPADPAPSR
jgi:lipoprotein-anchoring transpeptidase ErfK/SrfK